MFPCAPCWQMPALGRRRRCEIDAVNQMNARTATTAARTMASPASASASNEKRGGRGQCMSVR